MEIHICGLIAKVTAPSFMSPNFVKSEGPPSTASRDIAAERLLRVIPVSDIEISREVPGEGSCYMPDSEAFTNV